MHKNFIIIGAGIIGCSIAYHLTKNKVRDILILEKNMVPGEGSTGKSAGGIRQQFSTEEQIKLGMLSIKLLNGFQSETGVDPDFHQNGYLFLSSTAKSWQQLHRDVLLQNRIGLDSELLTPVQIQHDFPFLETGDLFGGAYCGSDGYCNPSALLQGYLDCAKRQGVVLLTDREVINMTCNKSSGTYSLVCSNGESFQSHVLINASGPYASKVSGLLGIEIPITPCKRQLFMTRPERDLPLDLPLTIDLDAPFYFKPETGGFLMSIAEVYPQTTFDLSLDRSSLPILAERASHRVPAFQDAQVLRGWAGLRSITPDHLPIIGETPGFPGFYQVVGFSGHGVGFAPAVGKLLADTLVQNALNLDLTPFHPARFLGSPQVNNFSAF